MRMSMAVLLVSLIAGPAWADADQGAIAGGTVAAAAIEGHTKTAIAGAVGYRFNRAIGIQVEVTWIPNLKPDVAALNGSTIGSLYGSTFTTSPTVGVVFPPMSPPAVTATDGRSAVVATTMRIEIPTTSRRVIPYAIGGGGVANIREAFTITFPRLLLPSGVPVPNIPIFPPQTVSQSSTDLALTLGAGASVVASDHLSIDVDVRYFRFLGNRDLNIGRFGIGASWRF